MIPASDSRGRWLVLFVILIRMLFLNQAVQGDDPYYLKGAEHALIDPLHPTHARYAFQGVAVDMLGHPHPPLNAWFLALLLAVFGDVHEAKFHALYMIFPVVAALAVWSLARRFSPRPMMTALLVVVAPAFIVNGGSFESDLPFLAFWLAGIALFIRAVDENSTKLLAASAAVQTLSMFSAFQSAAMIPILGFYLWQRRRGWRVAWLTLLAAPAAILGWQLFERISSGSLPVAVLGGYFQKYGLQSLGHKLRNAAALTVHMGWILFPALSIAAFSRLARAQIGVAAAGAVVAIAIDPNPLFWVSFGTGLMVLIWCAQRFRTGDNDERFLCFWVLLFFGMSLALFFAGSARYLLPLACPVAILATRMLPGRTDWLTGGAACNLAVALGLAVVNYQHWGEYRDFAERTSQRAGQKRVWINAELGLRYYLESGGGLPYLLDQQVRAGDLVVTSELTGYAKHVNTGGGRRVPVDQTEIGSWLPFRLIALNSKSGYSTAEEGLRPFDLSWGAIDRLSVDSIVEQKPTLSVLPMNAPEAEQQIVSGISDLEGGAWRWMSDRGVVLLLRPRAGDSHLSVDFVIPDASPAREVTLEVDGKQVAKQTYSGPGKQRIEAALAPGGDTVSVSIGVDKTFSVPGDQRRLGIILTGIAIR